MTGTGGTTGMGGTTGTGGAPTDPRCEPPSGIVSWWHGDGDYDDAVGSNDGTTGGAANFGAGISDLGFNLGGVLGAYVEVPDDASLDMTGAITIDAWINSSTLGGRIVDKITAFNNDGYLMDLWFGRLRMFVGQDAISSDVELPAGMFTHVAGVFDGSSLRLYVNGAPAGVSMTSGSPIPVNALTLRMGADSTGGSLFNGVIDEPRIFNRALSATEIESLVWQTTNCP